MCRGLAALPSTCIERAKEMKVHLGHFLHKSKLRKPSTEDTLKGGQFFEKLLTNKRGVAAFRSFLRSEFSEENIDFWLACEEYKNTKTGSKLTLKAQKIYDEFVRVQAPKEVNLDSLTREIVTRNLSDLTSSCFEVAQERTYSLMEKDSFPRFLKSNVFLELLNDI
ncbi:regulator of G-protein signaling 16-like [Carcharodon carcharias]|uniref:regulator of G-protein signaling 16-like n=1 Tax=Carcharodon carcharias TaxID=13397 RepID=UPI001B7EE2A0|nr:regulator of G-protein signaling 16-like [Carcharodon carcharias]